MKLDKLEVGAVSPPGDGIILGVGPQKVVNSRSHVELQDFPLKHMGVERRHELVVDVKREAVAIWAALRVRHKGKPNFVPRRPEKLQDTRRMGREGEGRHSGFQRGSTDNE